MEKQYRMQYIHIFENKFYKEISICMHQETTGRSYLKMVAFVIWMVVKLCEGRKYCPGQCVSVGWSVVL